jgi:hypothetical protein
MRRASGHWTSMSPLPTAGIGLPLMHREMPWTLALGGTREGQIPYYRLLPLTPELGMTGGRIDCVEAVADVAVGSVDDWTFVLVEQDVHGAVLLRRIESAGSSFEMEIELQQTWLTGWPADARLIGVDGSEGPAGELVAFGREPSGAVHVARLAQREPAPALAIHAASMVAGALLAVGPVVAEIRGTDLFLHVLDAQGWHEASRIALPASGVDGGTSAPMGALALSAMDEARRQAVAAFATPSGRLLVATHDGTTWTDARVLPASSEAPPRMQAPPDGGETAPSREAGPTVTVALAAIIALAAAAVAAWQLWLRLRRD